MSLKLIIAGIVVVFLGIVGMATAYQIEEYEVVILTRYGKITSIETDPGLHFKIPGVYSANFIQTSTAIMTNKAPENTYTVDNQEVDVTWKLFFHVPRNEANLRHVWTNVQDYKKQLEAIAVDRLKVEMGKVNVNHVAAKRGELRDSVFKSIKEAAVPLGVNVIDLQLPSLDYTKSFRQSVDAAAVAKAMIETKTQEWEQAKMVAESVREKARGESDAYLLQRTAEAKAIELKGKAEAESIRAQAEALKANTQLTELRKAEKWNGELPKNMLSNVMPFMNVDQHLAK